MLQTAMSNNSTSLSEEATLVSLPGDVSPTTRALDLYTLNPLPLPISPNHGDQQKPKKKRNLPGNPDPDAEVIALSPRTLMATNRFVCEICNKGFQRDQNLQLHRRGHNLPWKLRQRNGKEAARKRVYVCPEPTCVHNHPSRALGDLTGIKKHFCRKHGEKIWKCDRCSKRYAVMSDWKAHAKTCGTREYRCDCGTLFSRRDSFVTHRAYCDALAEESARLAAAATAAAAAGTTSTITALHHIPHHNLPFMTWPDQLPNPNPNSNTTTIHLNPECTSLTTLVPSSHHQLTSTVVTQPQFSATALLQKASIMGCIATSHATTGGGYLGIDTECPLTMSKSMGNRLSTRDFLGGGVAPPGGGQGEVLLSGSALDLVPSPCENNPTTTTTTTIN